MSNLNIELCPETGICSIIKGDGTKIDLMPDEVNGVRDAGGNPEAVKQTLAAIDAGFAEGLKPDELAAIYRKL
jgi:hypothetical protein